MGNLRREIGTGIRRGNKEDSAVRVSIRQGNQKDLATRVDKRQSNKGNLANLAITWVKQHRFS